MESTPTIGEPRKKKVKKNRSRKRRSIPPTTPQTVNTSNIGRNAKDASGSTAEDRDDNSVIRQEKNIVTPEQGLTPQDVLEEETNDLSEKLKIAYENIKLPNVPWMDEGNLLLGSYYVDLKLHAEETEDKKRSISSEESDANDKTISSEESDANDKTISSEESDADDKSISSEESDADDKSISVEEIFHDIAPSSQGSTGIVKQEKTPKRILISAPPGYGKTTLACKIIHDWARQQKEYVRRFKLAFLLKLKNLEKDVLCQLADIAESCGFENKDTVGKIVRKHGSSTLVILDGLDELNPPERINVYKVLFRSALSNVTVVTTCRTGGYTINQEEKDILFNGLEKSTEFHDQHITIEGLNRSNRKKLLAMLVRSPSKNVNRIRKIIKEKKFDDSDADEDDDEDDRDFEDKPLLQCPLFVILLAFIVEEKSNVEIETKTDLYKCIFDCLIRRSCYKNGTQLPSDFTVFDSQESWNYYRKIICNFGKLSTNNVTCIGGGVRFDYNEVTNIIYELGFLVKYCDESSFSKKYYYDACHSSVMEFAFAYFVWKEYIKNNGVFRKETIRNIINSYNEEDYPSLVIRFLCGLFGDELSNFVNVLLPISNSLIKSDITAYHFADCKSTQNLPDKFHVLFPKVVDSRVWMVQTQLFNKVVPWKTLKFANGITDRDFSKLSDGLGVNYLQIEINRRSSKVPELFNHRDVFCKKLKFCITSDVEDVEEWLKIFNFIKATEIKKLQFTDGCSYLDSPKINDLLTIATENPPVNCQIVFKTNSACHISNYTNLSKVVINALNRLKAIPENVLTAMSVSDNLQTVCIYKYHHGLDISLLTNYGKKRWESLSLECVKTVNCSSELVDFKCISSFRNIKCVNSPAVFESIVPDVLYCDDGYITQAFESTSFLDRWPSVKELILEIGQIMSYTEVMSRLTSLCRIHMPKIRLRFSVSSNDFNGKVCAGSCDEHAVIDFMKSFYVTEVYCSCDYFRGHECEICLFRTLSRTLREKQVRLNTLIVNYPVEDNLDDAFTFVCSGNVMKVIVILDCYDVLDVDVLSRFDFTKFEIQYGYINDYCPKVSHLRDKNADYMCISLK